MALRAAVLIVLLVASLGFITALASSSETLQGNCVYTVYVRTGSIIKAGTDSNISLSLGNADGELLEIGNLVTWGGLMGENYDYFERSNLDIFSGRGPCISSICSVILRSDGTGQHHGWYCEYVEVTSTGPHIQCQQHLFRIDQWLATDAPPYELSTARDECVYVPPAGTSSL